MTNEGSEKFMQVDAVVHQCTACRYYQPADAVRNLPDRCPAFPKGIPGDVWRDEVSHDRSIEGDNGIVRTPF